MELSRRKVLGGILTGPALVRFTGPCTTRPPHRRVGRGLTYTGQFFSDARRREVGYTLAYPPGYVQGDVLPLAVYLHPHGGSHLSPFGGYPLAAAVSLGRNGKIINPIAMVCADGGDGYWHPRPGDDPMGMVVDELVPMCRRIGLGHDRSVFVTGIEMGGYGAILFAEQHPEVFGGAAAVSPSIWLDYASAEAADPYAFTSAAQFAHYDVVRQAGALARKPLRVVHSTGDGFGRGVAAFARRLPRPADVVRASGAGASFYAEQAGATMLFLSALVEPAMAELPHKFPCAGGATG